MLKALEIVGFKSFAERTRFEFRPGITAIVGPNGSGKSNIVDAVKWVLGEQSVKSLRGREMADVIFNGSAGRRPLNSAEITLTLDNSKGLLPLDTPEVHITRRVYRGGESEYLINRRACRLRDIRDILAGTGLATQAYSVIEQGKIDQLLQASPIERRAVFEEAAGISRFKAKKLETLRRLDRIDQNLLRLADIVEEVQNRLRVVRSQAGKAERYRRHTERLRELRTHAARLDWTELNRRLAALTESSRAAAEQRERASSEQAALESELARLQGEATTLDAQSRELQAAAADLREKIAAAEAAIAHQMGRLRDTEREIGRMGQAFLELHRRVQESVGVHESLARTVGEVEERRRELARTLAERERDLSEALETLDRVRLLHEQRQSTQWEELQTSLNAANAAARLETRLETARAEKDRIEKELSVLRERRRSLSEEMAGWEDRLAEAERCEQAAAERLESRRSELARVVADLQAVERRRREWEQHQAARGERRAVLQQLESRREGVEPGVKEFLRLLQEGSPEDRARVRGLVADLLRAEFQAALLVDAALGESAQYVVVTDSAPLFERWLGGAAPAGRVAFLRLDVLACREQSDQEQTLFADLPGVLGRAADFVETDPDCEPLKRRLLGNVWFVDTLATALRLSDPAGTARFVTLAGEVVEADVVIAGPKSAGGGLVSRKSELRALDEELQRLAEALARVTSEEAALREQVAQEQAALAKAEAESERVRSELTECRHRLAALRSRWEEAEPQVRDLEEQSNQVARDIDQTARLLEQALREKAEADGRARQAEELLTQAAQELSAAESAVRDRTKIVTDLKVELAKCEERLRNLHAERRRQEEAGRERLRERDELWELLSESARRCRAAERSILAVESQLALTCSRKEAVLRDLLEVSRQRATLEENRVRASRRLQAVAKEVHAAEAELHRLELESSGVIHEKTALASRLREDYGITPAELDRPSALEDDRGREEIQAEMDDLRRKIHQLGNVNLEALEELSQLERRYETLSEQYQDLTSAKTSLQRIIDRINTDSRRLFLATLESVREHFGVLFRELFGGGQASIELEEGVDVLESGIEIVARPPGKEPRSISLLSGGEKTLTCVALLLAMFRSRPSMFCVLDEVDAALDEANIDRFAKVLRDFLSVTQFLIITHSKKTMTCADAIYGITMEESGVSKRVSVRFEDVSENGEFVPRGEDEPASAPEADQAA
ncbi:chromosome segregation protein SMC [Thermopirellula anaerolimosa]